MSVALDILRSYRAPGTVIARRAAGPVREDRAIAILMAACVLMAVAQWPNMQRVALENPDLPQDGLVTSALFGWVFLAPLFFYGLAALAHLVARVLGGRGRWFDARIAVFWGLLASTPLWLLDGLVRGFVGLGTQSYITGTLATAALLVFWVAGLLAVERRRNEAEA